MKYIIVLISLLFIGCKHDPGGNGSTSLITGPTTPTPVPSSCTPNPPGCGMGWGRQSCVTACCGPNNDQICQTL